MLINGKEYKLVPVEPTEEMLDAICNAPLLFSSPDDSVLREHWALLLAAATTPPEATEAAQDALDAARWRAFRARDALPDLDYTAFQDQFREDADAVIDAAIAAGGEE